MADLKRDQLSSECASLIADAEAELRAIRAAFGAHAMAKPRTTGLRLAPAPLRGDSPESAPPPLPGQAYLRAVNDKR